MCYIPTLPHFYFICLIKYQHFVERLNYFLLACMHACLLHVLKVVNAIK